MVKGYSSARSSPGQCWFMEPLRKTTKEYKSPQGWCWKLMSVCFHFLSDTIL